MMTDDKIKFVGLNRKTEHMEHQLEQMEGMLKDIVTKENRTKV